MPIIHKLFGDNIKEVNNISFSQKEQIDNTIYHKNKDDNKKSVLAKTNNNNYDIQDTFEPSKNYLTPYNNQHINQDNPNKNPNDKIELKKNKRNNIDDENKNNSKKYSITKNKEDLSDSEKRLIAELERMDRAVKNHEAAHKAAGGGLVRGGATYTYVIGPDGKRYASSGEVKIDMSYNLSNPEETIRKMEQVKRAALAPIDPSAQDRAVAQGASAIESEARVEEQKQQDSNIAEMMNSFHKSAKINTYQRQQNIGQIVNEYK